MTTQQEFDIKNVTPESLSTLHPDQVIQLAIMLKEENDKLRKSSEEAIIKKYDERLEKLERELNLQNQYERRNSIEISGVPASVTDEQVEAEVLKILQAAKAKVNNNFPRSLDIQAAHRKGRNGVIICKFVNRKFATSAVINSRNLKNAELYVSENDDGGSRLYINPSLCPEFGYLHFAARKAKKNNEIQSYKVRYGVMYIRKTGSENDKFIQISHVNDLVSNGLTVPPRNF